MKTRPLFLTIIFIAAFATTISAQSGNSPTPFYGYYYDYKLANPAFIGNKGKHVITTVYSGFPSGNTGAMLYGSYERSIASVKSGVGTTIIYDQLGPVTYVLASALYSKRVPFNETSGLRFGTQVFYQSKTVSYDYFQTIYPDDPLIGASGRDIRETFNFDLGLVYYSQYGTLGASIKNILNTEDDLPMLNLVLEREFKVIKGLTVTPSVFFRSDFNDKEFYMNSTFEIAQWILLGSGYRIADQRRSNLTFNAGLNIKDWVQIVGHVYSSAYYNYVTSFDDKHFIEMMIRVKIPESTSVAE